MLFYEPLFLFVFLPLVLVAFLAARRRAGARAWVLLVASVFFYLWSQPLFVPVVLATCVTDYALGLVVARGGGHAVAALAAGVVINLGMLTYFKYADFAADNFAAVAQHFGAAPWHLGQIALPVGVSFIVFEKISYLVDLRRAKSQPAPNFSTYLLFVFLFPKLLAGPIMKYHELEAQLRAHGRRRADDLAAGWARFMLGVVKKTILADTLASGADMTFNADPRTLGCVDAWWGAVFFAFQIYIDFSSYTDMAIGLARMFGFQLNENFNQPYIAVSMTDFWRRWHMSLTSWIREYLYIPLGGNRVPVWRTYLNLWVCFLASGLWHGAAWNYLVWGAYNGLFLVLDRVFLARWLARLPAVLANAATFVVVLVGWVFFRAGSLAQAGAFFAAMARPGLASHAPAVWRTAPMLTAAAAAALISFLPRVPGYAPAAARISAAPAGRTVMNTLLLLLFLLALAMALANPFKPFLYFRF